MRSGVQIPRMNAIMKRWVRTCRRELLDRTLTCNQRHLLHVLPKYEQLYNEHRPHQGLATARPRQPLPEPITDPDRLARLDIRRRDRLGGILHEYQHAARPARMRFPASTASSTPYVMTWICGRPAWDRCVLMQSRQDCGTASPMLRSGGGP